MRKKYRFGYHVVYYAWLVNGKEHRSHTVVEALSKESAQRKFQRENPHVLVVPDERLSKDPSFIVNLSTILRDRQLCCA